MSELGDPAATTASAVAIILLVLLLAEYEILRVVRGALTQRTKRALLVAIVPLLAVFVLVGVLRLSDIASVHP
jgi:hypothetical protein